MFFDCVLDALGYGLDLPAEDVGEFLYRLFAIGFDLAVIEIGDFDEEFSVIEGAIFEVFDAL